MINRSQLIILCTVLVFINVLATAQNLSFSRTSEDVEETDTIPSTPTISYPITRNPIDCEVNRRSDSSKYDARTKIVELYGNAVIEYCSMRLEANEIHYNTETGDAEAFAVRDSLGNVIQYAVFSDGGEELQYEHLRYNFKSRKGKVKQLVTRQGDGVVWGETVKQIGPGEFYVYHTRYSSCNLDHPHYYFTFEKSKIRNKKFAAGKNLNLYIKDIPTPLYFPFAIFPLERGKRAGFTRPRPGYDRERGFNLQDLGWYQPINDNMDAMITADIFTSGSWNMNALYRYQKLYKYRVNFDFGYSTVKGFDVSDALGVNLQNSFQLNFGFTQDPKVWKNSNLNATLRLGQRNYKQINVTNPEDRLNNTYTSSVSFNTRFPNTPFSLSSNLRYNQNTQSQRVSMSLPEVNLSMNTIYPFRGLSKPGKTGPLNDLNLSYRSNFKNNLELGDSTFFNNPLGSIAEGSFGAKHSIPVGVSFKIAKFFTLSPSFGYDEVWTNKNYAYSYDEDTHKVIRDTVFQFRTTRWYNTGVGLNTRIFGMKNFKKGKIAALRHVMTPTISMNYNPDFSKGTSGGDPLFYNVQVDSLGNTREYALFEGSSFGGPPRFSGGSVGFQLSNNIEMKIRSDKDTTGFQKIKIFESLNISTNYNLKADSLNLSPISINGNTKLFKKVSMNISGTFNPYAVDPATGRRINEYFYKSNKSLAEFVNGSFRMSASLNNKAKDSKQAPQVNLINNPLYPGEQLFADNYTNSYIDFKSKWDLRLGYNLSYGRTYATNDRTNIQVSNAITAQGNFNLTDEWGINYSTGYDFRKGELNYSRVRINRDLHCWQMGFSWQPIGAFKSYNFIISPKSSLLSGFKVEKKRTYLDNFN